MWGMMKVFLSHSSYDKKIVRRVNDDLKSHGYQTWLDEEKIPYGGDISTYVQEGLRDCEIVLIFLSEKSVTSKWVKREWNAKIFEEIENQRILVVPVLLEICDIPPFLISKRYADFREVEKYETNISLLLASLDRIKEDNCLSSNTIEFSKIYQYTVDTLEDLKDEFISLPVYRKMPILSSLKKLERSGKKVRLENFRPSVKIRSVYDHIHSVAHVADSLLPYIDHGLADNELAELARCIAYHELNEIVLGDIPTYTSLSQSKRKTAKVFAEARLRSVPPSKREKIANDFIWMFVSEKHRRSILEVNEIMKNKKSSLYLIFKALDKIDPIIATWRYLHHYRGKLGDSPKKFNRKMKDFFENPDIKSFISKNNMDANLYELVRTLQDRALAWDYYLDAKSIHNKTGLFSIPSTAVAAAIEGIDLFVE